MRHALLAATALLGFTVPYAANAAVVLTMGQSANNQAIVATANAGGTATTIVAADAPVTVTQIDAATPTPAAAFFDMNIASVGVALPLAGGAFQHYSGSFSVTSGAGGSGINYLSGTFADIVFGNGASGVLAAGGLDPISFTSSVIPTLDAPRAVALSFANLSPEFTIIGSTIDSFTSSVSGTFSANAVPEPIGLAVLGVGLLGLGMVRMTRRS